MILIIKAYRPWSYDCSHPREAFNLRQSFSAALVSSVVTAKHIMPGADLQPRHQVAMGISYGF
ncbi:MAG TPA: hypothetical protein VKE70_27220 [Candidatus Solibacter sp.]|nr:hypothetical protein [Candidatus Solibacter sp.]